MPVPFASQGDKNTIPVTPSTETGQSNYASYQKGFPPVTMTPLVAGGLPPQGMDMNGILFALSSSVGFMQSGGLPTFDADFASTIGGYPLGAVLQSNDGASAYVSTIANNTTDFNSSPESIGTSWLPWAGDAAKGSSLYIAVGEGTSDAITATFDPAITELTNGLVVFVRALASNATTTPTFNPDGLGAATITKGTYQPLAVGDIAGNGYWMILQYDSTQGKWVLQNPATGIASQDVSGKANVSLDNVTEDAGANLNSVGVRTVIDTYSSGTSWYRKWSDGWVEQGGYATNVAGGVYITLPLAMSNNQYFFSAISQETGDNANIISYSATTTNTTLHLNAIMPNNAYSPATIVWMVAGMGA